METLLRHYNTKIQVKLQMKKKVNCFYFHFCLQSNILLPSASIIYMFLLEDRLTKYGLIVYYGDNEDVRHYNLLFCIYVVSDKAF